MSPPLNFEPPSALDYFAALVADDASFSLTEAAVAVGQDAEPGLDAQAVLAQIDELAARLKRRIPEDAAALQRLRLTNHYFFGELGFAGNVNDYYDPANSYLHEVLKTRRGIPITLALVYLEIAQQVGLQARGVSFPGHFLVKLHLPQGEVVLDPFTGQSLSRGELDERLAPYRARMGLVGDDEVPLGLFLQSASSRAIIERLLRNLLEIHRQGDDHRRALAVLDRLVILRPDEWDFRRERGLVQVRLGHDQAAARDLSQWLAHNADSSQTDEVRRQLEALRASGPRH